MPDPLAVTAVYDEDSSKAYERVKFHNPAGDEVMCPLASRDGKLLVSAQVSEGAAAGDVYTLKAKVADTAGDLHELSHEYVVE